MSLTFSSGQIYSGKTLFEQAIIWSGGVASNITINSGGDMTIHSGGVANDTTLNGGRMDIYSGGTANKITVKSGGDFRIDSGGSALNVNWTPCIGDLTIADGAVVTFTSKYSGVYFGSGSKLTSSASAMNSETIERGSMFVMSGGVANDTTVDDYGEMFIWSGGVANDTTLNGGEMTISSGGVANDTTNDGDMDIYNGGVANNTIVDYNGDMNIYSGGVANDTLNGGEMDIWSGGVASNTTVDNGGRMDISSGGVANNTIVNDYGHMTISYGGVASNTTVNSGGEMTISRGGSALNVDWTPCIGDVYIADGAVVTFADENKPSGVYFGSDNQLLSRTTEMDGKNISGYNCSMYVMSGGVANDTLNGGEMDIWSGGVANNTTNSRVMSISSGGVANSTTVDNHGDVNICSGGVANDTTVNVGYMGIYSGGVASNTTVNSGGDMTIYDGGVHRGKLTINDDGIVYVVDGAIIDFTVKDRKPEDDYLINNLSKIEYQYSYSKPKYTITVAPNQQAGIYKLAQGAGSFEGAISIGTESETYGEITVNGSPFTHTNGVTYSLVNDYGDLTLTINGTPTGSDTTPPVTPVASADITTLTNKNVTVTATFSEDSTVKEYSLDNKTWKTYTSGIVMEENGSVYFRAADEAGNYSAITTYTVKNIDKTAPEIPQGVLERNVPAAYDYVTVTYSSDSTVKQYKIGDGEWQNYTGKFRVTDNVTISFRAVDAAGNESTGKLVISTIDNTIMELDITANITTPTNKDVVLTATGYNGTVEYWDGNSWVSGNTITATENGNYRFRITGSGGKEPEEKTIAVTNIDKIAPVKPTAKADITTLTNKNVTVTATFSSDSTLKQYSLDNKTWETYSTGVKMTANGKVYFRGTDEAGNISDIAEYSVNNIDKTPPVKPAASANTTKFTDDSVIVSAAFSKDSTVREYSLDNENWQTYSKGIVMENNGTVYFRAADAAGNYSSTAYTVNNIIVDPVPQANITAATNKNVTVTALFNKKTVLELYSLDGKTWKNYTKGIVFKKNGTVYFRAVDADLNLSAITTYTVKNIDTAKPKIKKVTATVKGYSATLKISATDNTKVAKYVVTYGKISKTFTSNSLKLDNLAVGKVAVSVVAYDAAGNKSSAKKVNLTIKDTTPPSKVVTLKNPVVTGKYKGTFSWSAAKDNSGKIARYEIQLDNGKIYKSTKTSVSISKLTVGKHTYRVRAIDKNKNVGAWSSRKSFTVKDMTAPSNVAVKVKVSGNNAVLTWKKPKDNVGVTKYILKYGSKTVTLKGSVTKYTITGLNKGKYSYSMVAVDAANNKSKAKTGKITIKQPLAPARAAEALYAADFAAPEALFAPQTDILAYCNDLQGAANLSDTAALTTDKKEERSLLAALS